MEVTPPPYKSTSIHPIIVNYIKIKFCGIKFSFSIASTISDTNGTCAGCHLKFQCRNRRWGRHRTCYQHKYGYLPLIVLHITLWSETCPCHFWANKSCLGSWGRIRNGVKKLTSTHTNLEQVWKIYLLFSLSLFTSIEDGLGLDFLSTPQAAKVRRKGGSTDLQK